MNLYPYDLETQRAYSDQVLGNPPVPTERTTVAGHAGQPPEPLLTVKLERGMKGTYGWTITYTAPHADTLMHVLCDVDTRLRGYYGPGGLYQQEAQP